MGDNQTEIKPDYLINLVGMKEVEISLYKNKITVLNTALQKAEQEIAKLKSVNKK